MSMEKITQIWNNFIEQNAMSQISQNPMASLAKWLSVRLRAKRLWVRVPLQSLDFHKICSFFVKKNWPI